MPVMDGLEATKRIRALPGGKDVKIAAVTASAFADEREEMLAAGMDDFVRKPYHISEIFNCMERQLGVHFVYEKVASSEFDSTLYQGDLVKLPEALRHELADALILGNPEQIAQIILRVEQHDGALAKVFSSYVANYNYLPVLKALESFEMNRKDLKS